MSKVRCAIYTRKSSEEGLDQAFNSLHAQREACEAYVRSQAGEGWIALPSKYDDGGVSGGTLERPALKRLLADLAAGRVDTIVVYKIDRLTRSLADFAKIVEQLDAAGASFVSVTQAFNTTTSMGRLTLNVLLSFAQFEREVTGERIRDKIAASKAKGMWMGGALPLGYDAPADPTTRALVVNPAEAETVRMIFERYLSLGSVRLLEQELAHAGVRSKSYASRRGRQIGGCNFSRGALYHLLSNRLYLGEITHKGARFTGRQPPIVPAGLFEAVQAQLASNRRAHREKPLSVRTAPLKGLVFDGAGRPMTPTFSHGRGGRIYSYYVSAPLHQGRSGSTAPDDIRRIPAAALDDLVLAQLERLKERVEDPIGWKEARLLLRRVEVCPDRLMLWLDAHGLTGRRDSDALERLRRRLPAEGDLKIEAIDGDIVSLMIPIRMKLRGGRSWMTTPRGADPLEKPRVNRTLTQGLRKAHAILRAHGLTGAGSTARSPASAYDRGIAKLAFLAPDLQDAILEGRHPPSLNLEAIVERGLPLAWADQRSVWPIA